MATIMIQNVSNSVTFLRIAVNPYPLSFLLLQDSFQDINILCTAAIRPSPRPARRALHLQSQGGGDVPGRVDFSATVSLCKVSSRSLEGNLSQIVHVRVPWRRVPP